MDAQSPYIRSLKVMMQERCPRCGEGALFAGFLKINEKCAHCGLPLAEHDSGDGPAVFLIFIIGTIVPVLALIAEMVWHPPYWLHAVLWLPMIVALTIVMLRPAKSLTLALTYYNNTGAMPADE